MIVCTRAIRQTLLNILEFKPSLLEIPDPLRGILHLPFLNYEIDYQDCSGI